MADSKTKMNELFALRVNRMTKYHLIYIMYERACNVVHNMTIRDKNVKAVFMKVFSNFALKQLSLDSTPLYETGFFGDSSGNLLDAAYKKTLIDLRPDMIGLVELLPEGG